MVFDELDDLDDLDDFDGQHEHEVVVDDDLDLMAEIVVVVAYLDSYWSELVVGVVVVAQYLLVCYYCS